MHGCLSKFVVCAVLIPGGEWLCVISMGDQVWTEIQYSHLVAVESAFWKENYKAGSGYLERLGSVWE